MSVCGVVQSFSCLTSFVAFSMKSLRAISKAKEMKSQYKLTSARKVLGLYSLRTGQRSAQGGGGRETVKSTERSEVTSLISFFSYNETQLTSLHSV